MLTEETYLFSILFLFFVVIIMGYKVKGSSKSHERKKSSTRILIINEGKTRDFPSMIENCLQKYATIEMEQLKGYNIEKLEAELRNYHKVIFICKIGERMELHQEKIIRDLDQHVRNDLKVFYLLNQGSGSYHVTERQGQEVNVFLHEIDEKFLEKSLRGFVDMASLERWMSYIKLILFFLAFLWFWSIYGYLQSKSARGEEEYAKLQAKVEEFEKLKEENSQISQKYEELLKDHEKLTENSLGMERFLWRKEQYDFDQSKKLREIQEESKRLTENNYILEKLLRQKGRDNLDQSEKIKQDKEEIRKLTAMVSERDGDIKKLKDDLASLNKNLLFPQNHTQDTQRSSVLEGEKIEGGYQEPAEFEKSINLWKKVWSKGNE